MQERNKHRVCGTYRNFVFHHNGAVRSQVGLQGGCGKVENYCQISDHSLARDRGVEQVDLSLQVELVVLHLLVKVGDSCVLHVTDLLRHILNEKQQANSQDFVAVKTRAIRQITLNSYSGTVKEG